MADKAKPEIVGAEAEKPKQSQDTAGSDLVGVNVQLAEIIRLIKSFDERLQQVHNSRVQLSLVSTRSLMMSRRRRVAMTV